MSCPTPAKRMHALASKNGLLINEFSPGLRVWTIRAKATPYSPEPLAFGVPHSELAAKIQEIGKALQA